jgi:hypothetical protein
LHFERASGEFVPLFPYLGSAPTGEWFSVRHTARTKKLLAG